MRQQGLFQDLLLLYHRLYPLGQRSPHFLHGAISYQPGRWRLYLKKIFLRIISSNYGYEKVQDFSYVNINGKRKYDGKINIGA